MADIVSQLNIGAIVAAVSAVRPQSSTGGTITGASIDRFQHEDPDSCVLYQDVGAVSGAPTAVSVQTTLQHSPDNSTWSNYAPSNQNGSTQQTATIAAANTSNSANINISSAYRYIRAVMAVTLTGGTTPAALVASSIVLGGEAALPAV